MKKSKIEIIREYEENLKKVKLGLEQLNIQKEQLIEQYKLETDTNRLAEIENMMKESEEKYKKLYLLLTEWNIELKRLLGNI